MATKQDLDILTLNCMANKVQSILSFESISFKRRQRAKHNSLDLVLDVKLINPLVAFNAKTQCYHFIDSICFTLLLNDKKAYGGGFWNDKAQVQKAGDCQITARQHSLPNIAVNSIDDLERFGVFFSSPNLNADNKLTSVKDLDLSFDKKDLVHIFNHLREKKGQDLIHERNVNLVYM